VAPQYTPLFKKCSVPVGQQRICGDVALAQGRHGQLSDAHSSDFVQGEILDAVTAREQVHLLAHTLAQGLRQLSKCARCANVAHSAIALE